MDGTEVFSVLSRKGVNNLYHSNTVTTACTFLQVRGLASRGYVKDNGMPQTPQYTDYVDKMFGIWYDVFLDGVDLHERGRIRNNYGPVLFILPTTILLNLPSETEVFVSRKNPSNWIDGKTDEDRYLISEEQLQNEYTYGDFGKHIILRTTNGILPFDGASLNILLDNPQCNLLNGDDAYTSALSRLQTCGTNNGFNLNITMRRCRMGCQCLTGHRLSYDQTDVNTWF